MPQLAFFPWLALRTDIDVGDYSLTRFVRGRRPRSADGLQETLDALLAPYHFLGDGPIKYAVILTAHDRDLTDELSPEDRADLFEFAELFAFAALAAREFFSADYWNRGQLRLVIQAFTDPKDGAFLEMRRRDGSDLLRITGDRYMVQAPMHVTSGGQSIKLDCALLEALLAARAQSRERWSRLHRGIVLFNQANTDAPDVSPHTDLMLTYPALEQVLGLVSGREQRQLPTRFSETWRPRRDIPESEWRPAPPNKPWKGDTLQTLRACWADDLRSARGNLAHGHQEDRKPSIWTVREHLLLTSFVVPRLVKRILADMSLYELTDDDHGDISALEPLLNLPDAYAQLGPHEEDFAWRRVLANEHLGDFIDAHIKGSSFHDP